MGLIHKAEQAGIRAGRGFAYDIACGCSGHLTFSVIQKK